MTTPHENSIPSCICGKMDCTVPFGLCHCGCGKHTKIARYDGSSLRKSRAGMPFLFIAGHQNIKRYPIETGPTFKIDGVYCRLIPLTKGLHVIVDADDYAYLMRWRWQAKLSTTSGKFYAATTVCEDGRKPEILWMHRDILSLGRRIKDDIRQGDHVNGNSLDNRRTNLRIATNSQNCANQGPRRNSKSGLKGVHFVEAFGRWKAVIHASNRAIYLGLFLTKEEAHAAYCRAAREYHGEFARFK